MRDNGKLISEMGVQTAYMAQWYYYFGGLADKVEGAVLPIDKADTFNYTKHEPLGVVAALVPWNSPLLLTAWKLAPALAAGNTVVIKPSEFTSASVLEFMKLVEEAGFPPGVVNVVTGFGPETGAPLVEHPLVAKITFTGSDATGQKIYEAAARGLKRVSLELGGKSPNIVFDDADLDNAVKGAISGIFAATGQTCIAGSRLLVQRSIHDAFVEKLVAFAKTAKMGDPMLTDTQVGPITNQPQYKKVLDYIDIAKGEGASAGARRRQGDAVRRRLVRAADDLHRRQEHDAHRAGGSLRPGALGHSVRGRRRGDRDRQRRRLRARGRRVDAETCGARSRWPNKLQAGTVWINTYRAVSFMSPFGGYKRSGIGRESGQDMIKEYLQTKSVWISTATEVPNPFVMR